MPSREESPARRGDRASEGAQLGGSEHSEGSRNLNHWQLRPPALSRSNATGGTSEAARDLMNASGRAKTLEQLVLELVTEAPATGEEMLARLRDLGIQTVLYSVKPRFSALKAKGLVVDSGERGVSESGKLRSVRWRITTPEERAAFLVRTGADQ